MHVHVQDVYSHLSLFIVGASCSVGTGEQEQSTRTPTVTKMGGDTGGIEEVASGRVGRGSGRGNPGVGGRRGREKALCVSQ